MDFREFEYFVTISEEKNLSRAASKLFISQPALSMYLQRLEDNIGTPLFQKSGKQLVLTYAGQRYLHYAKELLSIHHSMRTEMADIRKNNSGLLRIGMPPFRCSFTLPAVLPIFHQKYPNVEIEIMEKASSKLDEALMDGQLDLVFYNMSAPKKELVYEMLAEDEIFVVTKKDHPVKEMAQVIPDKNVRGVQLEWLKDEVFLLQHRSQRQGEFIRRELKDKHIVPYKICENTNIRAAAALAANGYGIAFLAGGLMKHFQSMCEFDYYSLLDVNYQIHFVAAYRNGSYLPSYARDFIEITRNIDKQ